MLQALIELYREGQTGRTGSLLEGTREQAALPRQSILQRMFGENRPYSRHSAQMFRDLPADFEPTEANIRGLAARQGLQPGTKASQHLAGELARIRANKMLADPTAREELGVPGSIQRYGDIATVKDLMEGMGVTVRDTTKAGGTQTQVVNKLLRQAYPIKGAELRPPASLFGEGAGVSFEADPETGRIRISAGKDVDLERDRWNIERSGALNRRNAMEGYASVGNQIMGRVLAGEDVAAMGKAGELTALFRSALKQAGSLNQAANYGGATTVGQLIDKATDAEFIRTTSELSAGLNPLHFLLATSFAAAQGNKEIGKAELQAALKATQGVRSADPSQVASTLRASIRGLENNNRSYFSSYDLPETNLESLAPSVFQYQGGILSPAPTEPSDIPEELLTPSGAKPWSGSLDDLRKLYEQRQGNQ
jgi:hypothetical protein